MLRHTLNYFIMLLTDFILHYFDHKTYTQHIVTTFGIIVRSSGHLKISPLIGSRQLRTLTLARTQNFSHFASLFETQLFTLVHLPH